MKKRLFAVVTASLMLAAAMPGVSVNAFAVDSAEASVSAPPDTEAIELDWLPETEAEYQDFVNEYGHLSVHDRYIIYCDEINYSTGAEVVVKQSGDGEVKKVKEYDISDELAPPGTPSKVVMVYVAVTPGDVQLTVSQSKYWDPNAELTEKESGTYVVKDDYTIEEKTNSDEFMMGDVNNDGAFNVSDVLLLQKWLLAVPDTHLAKWKAADFCEDGRLDVFDLCLMKRALIEQKISEEQTVLYCNGSKIGASEEKGWYSTEYSNEITDNQLSEHPEILEQLNKVITKADKLAVTNMLEYNDWCIADYGEDYLYLPYGDNDRILHCKFGGDCGWLGDSDVQKLVKLLVENGFFSDKSLFSDFTEFLSSKHPATKMSIVPVGYSSGISEQSDKWSDAITSTAELADYTKLLYDSYYDTMQHNMETFSANYDDEFFAENVLLLKPIYLTDSSPEYTIDMVTYKDNKLIVDYTERISGEGCDVLGGLLGVVVVPKENYHSESIEWKLTTYDWNGIKSGYLAVFSGEDDAGTIHNTYVYKTDNGSKNYGFDFTNTTLNPKTLQETIIKQGYVTWTDSVFTTAEKNSAYDYVKLPGDSTHYSIDEFREMFIMN